jgi:glycosyltransferase involved in cell wall biosynthesis
MKILLPISLDRWRNPISTLLRACVEYNQNIEFHSFSNPQSDEDVTNGDKFWKLPNLHKINKLSMVTNRYDIIHTASYSHANYIAAITAKIRGGGRTKFLNTMNLEQQPQHSICWKRYHRVINWVDGFVAVSEAVAKDIRERVPSKFMGVIPNGFDEDFFDPGITDHFILPSEIQNLKPKSFVLTVSAIEPRKRPDIFIDLAKRLPEIQFVWAGASLPTGEQFLKEMRNLPNVIWLNGVSRRVIRALLKNALVFLFPSDREGLPLALIEALGMGLPAIVQPVSSMPELVRDNDNGRLINHDDLIAWENAVLDYASMSHERMFKISLIARQSVLKNYVWKNIGSAYGDIYKKLNNI